MPSSQGSGCGVSYPLLPGFGLRVSGLGLRVASPRAALLWASGFGFPKYRCAVWVQSSLPSFGFRVSCLAYGFGFTARLRDSGFGFRVSDAGFREREAFIAKQLTRRLCLTPKLTDLYRTPCTATYRRPFVGAFQARFWSRWPVLGAGCQLLTEMWSEILGKLIFEITPRSAGRG